ncbi:hypothetical protein OG455_09165 [Kitasatospora sp. NBC_01287]|uniref:hypothetical protein n=1 Tax=Kitasatospora sp. NBC_01287 TaxID=2903573 RepID=UPI00225367F5|nr:hypothetical protein [Kitasatospora sp. NBC_01287]MCX4745689.1 hypothetical protein [Kitasatospora sp. NBC_01287]
MTAQTRRSAGTRTFTDVLLSALRIRRLSTERDLADLAAGTTLQVFCSSPTLGTVRMMPIGKGRTIPHTAGGYLHLSTDGVRWQNRRTKETVELQGPASLKPSEKPAGWARMTRLDLVAGGERHVILIPTADIPLVTQALAAVGH